MKRLLSFPIFLLFFLFSLQAVSLCAAESKVHVIIAADGRAGFGANLMTDYQNMQRLFKENVPATRLNLMAMDPSEITPDNILQRVNSVRLAKDDTLIFYYSGHAANNAGNGGQYFQLKDRNGSPAELQRRTLLAALKEKGARLTVLLTDCCNIEDKPSDVSKEGPGMSSSPPTMTPIFEALLMKPEGTVDITSSKRGEASFLDSTEKKRGSCFTWPLVDLFKTHRNSTTMTWTQFAAELKTNVQKAFEESWPGGYKFDPPLNGISMQKTQTIEVYGSLPGVAEQSSAVNRGPRFGIRAVNHSAGVRITEVVTNSPGQRAGFEIGDVIIEINGKPIRNEQDYSDAVDASPKTMNAKVINTNDGQTLNVTFELGY